MLVIRRRVFGCGSCGKFLSHIVHSCVHDVFYCHLCNPVLERMAVQFSLPVISYVREIAEGGAMLAGMGIELPGYAISPSPKILACECLPCCPIHMCLPDALPPSDRAWAFAIMTTTALTVGATFALCLQGSSYVEGESFFAWFTCCSYIRLVLARFCSHLSFPFFFLGYFVADLSMKNMYYDILYCSSLYTTEVVHRCRSIRISVYQPLCVSTPGCCWSSYVSGGCLQTTTSLPLDRVGLTSSAAWLYGIALACSPPGCWLPLAI